MNGCSFSLQNQYSKAIEWIFYLLQLFLSELSEVTSETMNRIVWFCHSSLFWFDHYCYVWWKASWMLETYPHIVQLLESGDSLPPGMQTFSWTCFTQLNLSFVCRQKNSILPSPGGRERSNLLPLQGKGFSAELLSRAARMLCIQRTVPWQRSRSS